MKKVRYLMGAAGLAPAAVGLLAQAPVAAAASHPAKPASTRVKPGKTVYIHPDSGCTGSTPRQHTVFSEAKVNWLELGFWSAHHGAASAVG